MKFFQKRSFFSFMIALGVGANLFCGAVLTLTRNIGSQNLGCAGGIELFVDIFGIKDCTAVRIHQNRGASVEDRTLPVCWWAPAVNAAMPSANISAAVWKRL